MVERTTNVNSSSIDRDKINEMKKYMINQSYKLEDHIHHKVDKTTQKGFFLKASNPDGTKQDICLVTGVATYP